MEVVPEKYTRGSHFSLLEEQQNATSSPLSTGGTEESGAKFTALRQQGK